MNTQRILLALLMGAAAASAQNTVEVDASKVIHPIPRTIYGTFLEPIGRSTYGGLWAQLLDNPSFEDALWAGDTLKRMLEDRPELVASSNIGLPLPWEPLEPAQGWRYEPRWGDFVNTQRSLLIMGLPGQETGIRQEVYLPVHRVRRFTGYLYARPVSGPREFEVSLRKRNRPQAVLAKVTLPLAGDAWRKYDFALDLPPGALASREPADFVVSLRGEARVLVDQVMVFPADAVHGMNPEMIEMSRALKTPVVRFGGNYTSGYHWRDGIGPIDKRVSMLNQSWRMPEYNHFGTDEFLEFCRLIGAEPQVALNLGSGTPVEAAEWARYIGSQWGGKQGGLLWELGNELWGLFQIGYPTLPRVAERTRQFAAAVRDADAGARLIATGQDPDHFEEWNAAQLRDGGEQFSWLSTHFVVGTRDVLRPSPSLDFTAQAALALPVGLERRLRLMKQQIDADPRARGRVKIAFTEWLFHGGQANDSPSFGNMGGALCAAGFLNTLMRVADFTTVSDMTGLIEFGGVWQKRGVVYGVPAYWAFRMYSTADAARFVETRAAVETYDIEQGVRRIPNIDRVPYLDVTAALNDAGDKLTLFCVNRDLHRDLRAEVKLTAFAPRSAVGSELKAASLYEGNDEVRPAAIVPRPVSVKVSAAGLDHTFPRASVTVVEVERQ